MAEAERLNRWECMWLCRPARGSARSTSAASVSRAVVEVPAKKPSLGASQLLCDVGTMSKLLHQEASAWKERHGLTETKQVRQGAS